jgi:hypothetical protein
LTGLSDGDWLFTYGCAALSSAAGTACLSLKVNSTEAVDDDAAFHANTIIGSVARQVKKTLSNDGNNSVYTRFRIASGTGTFSHIWLTALKVANP